ncbi:hypothetical protein F4806DRAFT_496129 [Annulohypoxylon nitens]|nr:hypothetical protein F4806DRAFT_496129 [Annulohypoxylon nitens]
MSSTTSKKTQSISPTSISSKSDKESPDSNASTNSSTKQDAPERISEEEMDRMIRQVEEERAKMTDEEVLKRNPWIKYCREAAPVTASEVPELWDEI